MRVSANPLPAMSQPTLDRRPSQPPVALQRVSAFVLEILPWGLCGLIGLHLVWNLVA